MTATVATSAKDALLSYPGPSLGPQVRPFGEKQSVFAVLRREFFPKADEGKS
jgi:hypothetical protein